MSITAEKDKDAISKAYEPKDVEKQWYSKWLEKGCFDGKQVDGKDSYCIVIPPPNVTGVLTMGHVLNNTIQDILTRRARQDGKSALWLPGTDHAGIATQTRVEKELRKDGLTRHDLGREKFLDKAVEWRDKHGGIIIEQLKSLGCSCDWKRTAHTLDDDYSKSVLTAFVKLYKNNYIYRGKRMVNWCPASLTALSDEEVIMKPQKGKFYKMRYEIVENPGEYVEISTTRPETIMGDTGVAVHPDDERYKHLIGKHAWRPFPKEKIPFVADKHVDREFGTGVLKVTPAHDKADFEIGQRNNLRVVDVFNPDATLNELAGEDFVGLDRFKARKKAVEKLEELGLLIEIEDYENSVGYSERADVPVEPRLSEQWFLKYPRVEEAKSVIKDKQIRFWPDRWEKTYLHWLENIQDWCISRQLWWGHRIPVWYKKGIDEKELDYQNPEHVHVSLEGPSDPENWQQDNDVLDTWASSWLWPFATMGWPDKDKMKEQGLSYFYPTSDLVTGPDIIFFWVARMIMAGLEFYGDDLSPEKTLSSEEMSKRIPFKNVYFTGIIRDITGKKMSKSLGNSPDPLDLIAKYGADGLRYAIMSIAPKGQDIRFSDDRVEQGRNFCNKLWNACRFRQISGDSGKNETLEAVIARLDFDRFDADDHAIIARLITTIDEVNNSLDIYEFNTAIHQIYTFFWSDFCDWYLEVSKSKLKDDSLKNNCLALQDLCIRQVLLLLHPFTPFITEELWHGLGYAEDEDTFIQNISVGTGSELKDALGKSGITLDSEAVVEINNARDLVSKTRALKAEYNLANNKNVKLYIRKDEKSHALTENQLEKLRSLIGAESISVCEEAQQNAPAVITAIGTVYLDLSSAIDPEAEKARLAKELEKLDKVIRSSEARLNNEAFTSKAPANVVQGAKDQLEANKVKYAEMQSLIESYQ